ncbi:oligosaccharide flippase family protein [Chroococcidiopsis sp. FACHB-1243]|uniref:oligosaccharide flippase family protein n=1 Tax=Chroococcidiopsis sp. [FACHB-1243] TaxID=2692781 RepID=UPI0017876B3F|nr:oligosaccharide flippase family protein [Chroococcidiopsis sp. [FACHB-1243]]MBD2308801.1 oligosaccharide flippase family protein [Chroococcidiopsis sp. [FACHB-1243]]
MGSQQQKPLTLRRNFSWTFVGNAIYSACQWGMLVVLAKLGSPEVVGQFTLGLAITAPVLMFTNLQLRAVQATDAKHQYTFGDYLGLRLLATGVALAIIAAIIFFANYRWETSAVILVIGLAKVVESISDVFYGLIQQHERMDRIAISLIIKGPLSLLFLGFGVYITGGILFGVVGLAFAWVVVLIAYDVRSGALILKEKVLTRQVEVDKKPVIEKIKLQPRWDMKMLGQLVWLSLPLGIVMMLISLNTNIPRYFIEQYLGERDLGIFAAISYLIVAGRMLVSSLGESASPKLAKYYSIGDSNAFRTLIFKLLGIGILLGGTCILVALFAGREILIILYRPEYAKQVDLFVLLMVVAGVNYLSSFLGYAMTAARYFRIQIPLFILVTAISAIASFWLIPTNGLRGAAIALLFAAIAEAGLTFTVILHALHKLKNTPIGDKKL